MSDLLSVLSNLQSSSSGTGVSYYSTRCALQAVIDKAHPRESGFDAQVGTVYHKLQELYYMRQLTDVALPLDDMADFKMDPVQEALRVFSFYTTLHPADEWDVWGAEQLYVSDIGLAKNVATCVVGGPEMATAVGLEGEPFTMRLDLEVSMNAEQAEAFTRRCGKEIEPGRYIVDHKVKKQKDTNAFAKWANSIQFTAYYLARNAALPKLPVKGLIVNSPVRHVKLTPDSFYRFVIPPPSEQYADAVRQHLKRKAAYLKTGDANLDACFDWGGCSHWPTGRCNGVKQCS